MIITDIKNLDMSGLEARKKEIANELHADNADVEALSAEIDAIEERSGALAKLIEQRTALMKRIASGDEGTPVVENVVEEARKKDVREVRNTDAYIEAYARYIKTGDSMECRKILTENADSTYVAETDGVLPVPELVDGVIRTAWDKTEILSKVRQTNLKGNVKVGFEISSTAAVVHLEGASAPSQEQLILGIVQMIPQTVKKWITFSDEAMDMNGSAFLEYIYSELAYRIFKKVEDLIVAEIVSCPTTATTSTKPSVQVVTQSGIDDFVKALSKLSDEAANPCIIMNKGAYAYYKGLAMSANYALDPFEGMTVLFNNTLKIPVTDATGNYCIVGDLSGVQANFPNGQDIQFKYDDKSLAESDLIKVVGRLPVAIAVTACNRFCVIAKS